MSIKLTDEEILKQREEEYGSPKKSFDDIAKLWSIYLECEINAENVAMMMVLLKVHRSKKAKGFHFDDSIQDGRNYLTLASLVSNKRIEK